MGTETPDVGDKKDPEKMLFSQRMRIATRNIHTTSDNLVNAKLGVTISDDSVWAEGLLVFYEIFKYLESALERRADSLMGDLMLPGMARTKALEADLAYYLGPDWREGYTLRPQVSAYLSHLTGLEAKDPYLLTPYIYHLYMGLFSGGQILGAKRLLSLNPLASGSKDEEGGARSGLAVTYYGDLAIGTLKKQLKKAINDMAEELDEDTKEAIVKEGIKCFELNNTIISSVKGVDRVLKRRLLKMLIAVILALLFIVALFFKSAADEIDLDGDVFNLEGDKAEL